jgi:hypothetical protein
LEILSLCVPEALASEVCRSEKAPFSFPVAEAALHRPSGACVQPSNAPLSKSSENCAAAAQGSHRNRERKKRGFIRCFILLPVAVVDIRGGISGKGRILF